MVYKSIKIIGMLLEVVVSDRIKTEEHDISGHRAVTTENDKETLVYYWVEEIDARIPGLVSVIRLTCERKKVLLNRVVELSEYVDNCY